MPVEGEHEILTEIAERHGRIGREQLELLRLLGRIDPDAPWIHEGARDLAHLVAMRLGISEWKARRWLAARRLPELPQVAQALERGLLSLDKVVELTRFAQPREQAGLIRWARHVSVWAIRRRGDLIERAAVQQDRAVDRGRRLEWWFQAEERRFGLFALLPAAEGAVVASAIERMAARVPVMPQEQDDVRAEARRADALVAIAHASLAADPRPEPATVVVHTRLEPGPGPTPGAELDRGPVLHPETARRLSCDARVQLIVEDGAGNAVRVSPVRRFPPEWMVRQLRYRDRGCVFPGCGTTAFTVAHHLRHWSRGGPTTLDNLALLCSFHHRLVHEHGWRLRRDGPVFAWTRPDGTPYPPGPPPPARAEPSPPRPLARARPG
jgi:hypothetical protein